MTQPQPKSRRPFEPAADLLAKRPAVTGKSIIGWGEPDVRPPTMVFWAPDMDDIAFGDVQRWFYRNEPQDPELMGERAKRRAIIDTPLRDVAPDRIERAPADWTAALDAFVSAGDCERTGVATMRPEWIFDHHRTDFRNVIVLGLAHDYDKLKSAPDLEAGKDVGRQYTRAAAASKKVANWLRAQGWDAEAVTGPMVGKILMIPPAIEAGFGELGKHGSIINPELGSAFRLGAVLTDAPFAPTPSRSFGIDDFCSRCRVCEDACPPEAILPDKQLVRGVVRWAVDFDRCIPYFATTSGCAICIAVCPWSRPGVGLNLAGKLARRAERREPE